MRPFLARNYQGSYPRLLDIKRRCDPDNHFRPNANIRSGA
jgi:FAD/FMN-containing dehydrogenase